MLTVICFYLVPTCIVIFPTRRVPKNTELPTLRATLRRRNFKARQHYGAMYKRLRKYRKSSRMDFRVRILLLFVVHSLPSEGLNSVEEIPPPLQEQLRTAPSSTSSPIRTSLFRHLQHLQKPLLIEVLSTRAFNELHKPSEHHPITTLPSAAAPEFEDRNEPDEGGKGDEDPDASVDNGANVSPPADNVAVGEGVAKEDTEPVKDKDKEENQLGAMVEDAKGNVAVPLTSSKFQPRINFNQSEDSYFMTFVVVGGMFLFCVYLVYHNKKKILGLIFEGRASSHSRRNVRYRRLSQREEKAFDSLNSADSSDVFGFSKELLSELLEVRTRNAATHLTCTHCQKCSLK
ncbi:hypothetical protein KIN20_003722 [Parelaphostrongylus tenuis]|uniref:Transmembrane protein n=1 Tax=Parelaphostrongylus tenuis TaxID=148309 RepID=A0AAD5LZL1_PARTN|nr:hypothetical protein KIN20_003722 [Parelaphostrongylus tenuis]